jgi:copper homeostasis protein
VKAATGRIAILAGAGIRWNNVRDFVLSTGVGEVHTSLRTRVPSQVEFWNDKVMLGSQADELATYVVRESDVRELRRTLDGIAAELKSTGPAQ